MDKYLGKRLDGRYEIREIIGVGGMAYVYKAYDTIDDRTVAIKILRMNSLANGELPAVQKQIKSGAILSHPNIVKVYDVSFGNGIQYIVMEYIDGITLKSISSRQGYTLRRSSSLYRTDTPRALAPTTKDSTRGHQPQNVMLLPDGTIKVTDFGIARFARSDIRLTSRGRKGYRLGALHPAPEQARGEITDEKADHLFGRRDAVRNADRQAAF